jgi:hypothetical protein
VNTFDGNNRKNGEGFSNPITSSNSLDSLQKFRLVAPGIVTLPLCSAAEARENWRRSLPLGDAQQTVHVTKSFRHATSMISRK